MTNGTHGLTKGAGAFDCAQAKGARLSTRIVKSSPKRLRLAWAWTAERLAPDAAPVATRPLDDRWRRPSSRSSAGSSASVAVAV